MALFDAMFELSDDQVITDSDAASTNIIDFTLSDLEMGAGQPYWLNIRVGTAFAGGTSIVFSLRYDTVAPIDSSSTVIWQSAVLLTATLVAGHWVMRMPLPVNVDEERIVGLYYDVDGTMSAGTINAWLDNGPQSSYDTQVTTSNI
jgi:hypothetical protein